MTPQQALQVLAQVVSQTRALPHEVDAMRQALQVLQEAIGPVEPAPSSEE